ncbi:MAG: Arm DNA-binding domain-containing protein [Desulfobulbus sp.]
MTGKRSFGGSTEWQKNEINFTKAALEQAQAPAGVKRFYLYDERESGLVFQITPTGRKTFQLYKKHLGKPVRVTIGTFPELSVEQARKKAREIKVDLIDGINPNEERRAIREELTFSTGGLICSPNRTSDHGKMTCGVIRTT